MLSYPRRNGGIKIGNRLRDGGISVIPAILARPLKT